MEGSCSMLRLGSFWEMGNNASFGRIDGFMGLLLLTTLQTPIGAVPRVVRERRIVADAMVDGTWIKDIKGHFYSYLPSGVNPVRDRLLGASQPRCIR